MSNVILVLNDVQDGAVRVSATKIESYQAYGPVTLVYTNERTLTVSNTPEEIDQALIESYYMLKVVLNGNNSN